MKLDSTSERKKAKAHNGTEAVTFGCHALHFGIDTRLREERQSGETPENEIPRGLTRK
jgi:hypothetical protein